MLIELQGFYASRKDGNQSTICFCLHKAFADLLTRKDKGATSLTFILLNPHSNVSYEYTSLTR